MELTPDRRPHGDDERPGRCSARAKSTGDRCRRRAVPGATVCPMHGGAAPQVKAAAARRVADGEAAALLASLLPADAAPVTNVLTELARLAGELVTAREAAASMVRRVDTLTNPTTGDTPAELRLWLLLADRCGRLLADMTRLGIDARHVALSEAQGALIVAVMNGALADLGIPLTDNLGQAIARRIRARNAPEADQ